METKIPSQEKSLEKTIALFDAKPYDKFWFDKFKTVFNFKIQYFETKLNPESVVLASKCDAICAFVNDTINKEVIDYLYKKNIRAVALRCAGYNNVDFQYACGKVKVFNVPRYSPYSIAEHAMGLLLSLNRRIHRAYIRTRDNNFSLNGLMGFDLYGKIMGVIGIGHIGSVFVNIAKGFGMNVIAYDPYPKNNPNVLLVSLDEIFRLSDVISLHCPLNEDTHYIIDKRALNKCKENLILINTGRGALVDSEALLTALENQRIKGACLDVYEEEKDFFGCDLSNQIIKDDILMGLISLPNVLVTSHQAYFTEESLQNITITTFKNLENYFNGTPENEISYYHDETTKA